MKFAKTIRFDKSDLNIFPLASEEGELAVVGTFAYFYFSPSCSTDSLACVPVSDEIGSSATDDRTHCTNHALGSSVVSL